MVDVKKLNELINNKDVDNLKKFISDNDLIIKDKKITYANKTHVKDEIEYLDQRQHIKKLGLNALYGSILNPGCRFEDPRIGQSVTLTGRVIAKHMNSYANELITGEYNHIGTSILYSDTDSVSANTTINTSMGKKTIEELFIIGEEFKKIDTKEFSINHKILIDHYSKEKNIIEKQHYQYVYRHKVKKQKIKIITKSKNQIFVTNDHSIMVLVNSELVGKKPMDIKMGDKVIVSKMTKFVIEEIESILEDGQFDNEYVYDICMNKNEPWFFANNILVHNSSYFTMWPTVKSAVEKGQIEWSKETCIQFYDSFAEKINESFPEFMKKAFNAPDDKGKLIRCGREVVASKGLYITKKRYAVLMIDKDGKRLDIDGKPGKLKAMGLDLRRADTPPVVQDFLKEILMDLLEGHNKQIIFDKIKNFKNTFNNLIPWQKGTPKRVNNLTKYTALDASNKKGMIPGHVMASINWNKYRSIQGDKYSPLIVDGMKVIVCKLKSNALGFHSIAYPTDASTHLPKWFTELSFDGNAMESAIVDKKIENLLGVLNWNLEENTRLPGKFEDMFTFE